MQAKRTILHDTDYDLDKLIEEGEAKARRLKEEAAKEADKMKNFFDFSMESIDCF